MTTTIPRTSPLSENPLARTSIPVAMKPKQIIKVEKNLSTFDYDYVRLKI